MRVQTRKTGSVLGVLCATVMVGWAAFDRVLVPEHAADFLTVRLAAGALVVVAWIVLVRSAPSWRTDAAALGLLIPVQVGIAWMLPRAQAAFEAYLLGFSLAIYATAVFIAWHWRYSVVIDAVSVGALTIAVVAAPEPVAPAKLAVAAWYLGTAIIIGVGGHYLRHRSDRAEFSARTEERRQRRRNSELLAQVERLSRTDPLTGIANRRVFDAALEAERARAAQDCTPLGLVMLDLDRFKAYNDTLGHPEGDALLQAVAEALARAVRPSDTVARLGGDEFAVLVPGARDAEMPAVIARLQGAVDAALGPDARQIGVRISAGGATTNVVDHTSTADLLRDADDALYRDKRAFGGAHHREVEDRARTPRPPRATVLPTGGP
ncbi:diguanylate cyclase [Actinotalea sp.]|uniref:GGDEF domain-containing protein n=1 Tax=Actinotalea sp. TaxID=1872145 RepID=UPI002B9C39B1|nr:diguanylate cyclase [Actinotalea sp.]HQY32522.1 diguanylate cyclase [Actinotalea sp.]HRA51193.1 diguanylate cyclase [Actinotalea sp.]